MTTTRVTGLADLFGVFERLDRGETVVLGEGACLGPVPGEAGPHLGVRSSGSTGIPKVVWRSWPCLKRELRLDPRTRGWRWASPFRPESFAGVQAALQAWAGGGEVDSIGTDWGGVWEIHRRRPWDAVSATPTYMDLLIQNESDEWKGRDPVQITLGGEVLRPECGERLRERFPETRFTVVYASAEWGVLLKTHRVDGWYERASLERRYPRWQVREGVLELPDGQGEWVATGDLVEVEGELMRVVGRADRVANVAGTKVSLDEVGRLAEQVLGVRRAHAIGESNPVTGQVVALLYSIEPGGDRSAVEKALGEHLRACLPKPAWPRRWVPDDLMPRTNAKRGAVGVSGRL